MACGHLVGQCVLMCFSFCLWGITEVSQQLIVDQGGISLLSLTAADAEDPQTLRMVAGAIANLCGNGKITSLTSFSFEQETDQFLKCFFFVWQTNFKQDYGRMVE